MSFENFGRIILPNGQIPSDSNMVCQKYSTFRDLYNDMLNFPIRDLAAIIESPKSIFKMFDKDKTL